MTDERTARDQMIALVAAALSTLAHLYAHEKVTITNLWTDSGSGPGATSHERLVVRADVTGRPVARTALLAGLAPVSEPQDWAGSHATYREWHGSLLTMRVIVSMRLDLDEPPAQIEPAPVAMTEPSCLGAPQGLQGACGWPGPHGEHPVGSRAPMDPPLPSIDPDSSPEAHYDAEADADDARRRAVRGGPAHRAAKAVSWTRGIRAGRTAAQALAEPAPEPPPVPEQDRRPLLGLLVDERFGDLKSHVIEVQGEPGQSTVDLAERYAHVPGVIVVPGRKAEHDEQLRETYRQYAIARTIHYFEKERPGERFPTLADALTAVNLWPGRDMLENDWAMEAARQLIDPSAAESDRDPAGAGDARGRIRRLVPPALRGLGGEVVIR